MERVRATRDIVMARPPRSNVASGRTIVCNRSARPAIEVHVMNQLWCLPCAIATIGCGSFANRQAAASTYQLLLTSREAAQREIDVQLARDAMPSGMQEFQAFALAYPEQRGFRALYAEASCQYAAGFVFDDWEDAKLGGRDHDVERFARRLGPLLARCVDASLDVLSPAWRAARLAGPDAVRTLLALLATATVAEVPSLLWIATADALEFAIDPRHHVDELDSIIATLDRCAALSPGYHDASAELLLATLVAARSQVFGGDDGAAQFARARELAGDGALIVDVMFARGVAVARQDRALFETTLGRVLATNVARWPARRLGNELAQRKARRYLAARAVLLPE